MLPLAGANARFQPIYVGDVAACFERALDDNETIGERYSLCGPKVYTLAELVRYVAETIGHPRPVVALGPAPVDAAGARDGVAARLAADARQPRVDAGRQRLRRRVSRRLGVVPTALEAIAPEYLAPRAQHSRFDLFRAHGGR